MVTTRSQASVVAVPGGTSPTLGKSIVEAVLATGKHNVIILSRASETKNHTDNGKDTKYGAPIHYVDYNSIDSLTTALKGVTTLIVVLKMTEPGAMESVHANMLKACQTNNISRFIMGDWSQNVLSHKKVDVLASKGTLLKMCDEENNRPGSTTSCCTIQIGMFMNYFAQGSPSSDPEVTGGLLDDFMLDYIDIANNKLIVPVTSAGQPIKTSTTHMLDVGDLVAKALDLPPEKLRGHLGLVSQNVDFAYVRDILEESCGRHVSVQTITRADCDAKSEEYGKQVAESVQKGGFDLQAFMRQMVVQMVGVMCDGEEDGSIVPSTLNGLLTEAGIEARTRHVRDLVIRAWRNKE